MQAWPNVRLIENQLICCKENHNMPIIMVVPDEDIPKTEKLLCGICFQTKGQVSKYISVIQAQNMISEKRHKLSQQQEEKKQGILKDIADFKNQIMMIRSKVISYFEEILRICEMWIKDVADYGRKSDINHFLQDLYLLHQDKEIDIDYLIKSNQSHYQKIDSIILQLMNLNAIENSYKLLQTIVPSKNKQKINKEQYNVKGVKLIKTIVSQKNQQQINKDQNNQNNVQGVKLINTIKQEELSFATVFNSSGSLMVSGCGNDIKIWNFEEGNINEKQLLKGHTGCILSLVFSKKHNWFVSGGTDGLKLWMQDDQQNWVCKQSLVDNECIQCIIINNQEDQLMAGNTQPNIKVWNVNCNAHQLEYHYTLKQKHSESICCISLNDTESALVSCAEDKKIILWNRNKSNRYQFQLELTMDHLGFNVCFLSENQIIWQQGEASGLAHLFEIKQGKLYERTDLNILLGEGTDDRLFFRTINNKSKEIIIQRHDRYIYILKRQPNGQFIIATDPIDCIDQGNFGNLTENGQYLVVWNDGTKEFRIHQIFYE